MEPTKKKISEEAREKNLKRWNRPLTEGRQVVIILEPKRAKKTGFELGTCHTIVKPPKGYLNTGLGVWLESAEGKKVCLDFQYWKTTSKDYQHTKFEKEAIINKYQPIQEAINAGVTYKPIKVQEVKKEKSKGVVVVRRRRLG